MLLGGCAGSTPTPPPTEEIIERSLVRMESLEGFHYVIERSVAPAFLDAQRTLAFRRAEGDYLAPNQTTARIRVIGPGLVAEVQVISIGERQWETNVLTGEWEQLPTGWGFNPADLFDPQGGIHPVLEHDLHDLELEGLEALDDLPGERFYLISGEVEGQRLYDLSYGMMGPDAMDLRLWIAPESFDLVRMEITDLRPDQDEDTLWRIDFWDFGNTVDIKPPQIQEESNDR
jgi:hypothetical protein